MITKQWFVVFLLLGYARCWGEIGHAVVASLAENFLSESAQTHVQLILKYIDNQNQIDKSLFLKNDTEPIEINNLADISSFADYYKRKNVDDIIKKYPKIRKDLLLFQSYTSDKTYSLFNSTYNLHFQSNILKNTNELLEICKNQKTPPSFPCVSNYITKAIEYYSNQLRNPKDKFSAAFALIFIVHLIGDIHQPFHCAYADDAGGNKAWIYYPNEETCLKIHYFWDNTLISLVTKDNWKNFTNSLLEKTEFFLATKTKELIDNWWDDSFSFVKEYSVESGRHTSLPYTLFDKSNIICANPPFNKKINYGAVSYLFTSFFYSCFSPGNSTVY